MNSSTVHPLAHTLNVRGDLGAFVNPHTCSCRTCHNYVGVNSPTGTLVADSDDNTSFAMLSAIGEASHAESRYDLQELEERYDAAWRSEGGDSLRSPSTGATSTTHYLGAMQEEIDERRQSLGLETRFFTPIRTVNPLMLLPPPRLRRVDAFFSPAPSATDEEDLMERLRKFRSELQIKQDHTHRECFTRDEIDAASEEYTDLAKKIVAIEAVLSIFGTSRSR